MLKLHRIPFRAIAVGGYFIVPWHYLAPAKILGCFSGNKFKAGSAAHIVLWGVLVIQLGTHN
jgi:hypothetical protein